MFLKFLLISTLSLASSRAEAPLQQRAPYPPTGWRPQKPFNLPGEYLPPLEIEEQRQIPQKLDVEITRERVDFAGQIQGNSLLPRNEPQNSYLPPAPLNSNGAEDFLKVQHLPHRSKAQFNKPPKQLSSKPQPQLHFRPRAEAQLPRGQIFPSQQQLPTTLPAREYGPPNDGKLLINYPDIEPRTENANERSEEENLAIEALKAAVDAYNRKQNFAEQEAEGYAVFEPQKQAERARFTQGQYFVLGPDNTLQRVMFTTSQDEQEKRNKGFTAQLKYTPVGEISDPLFKYNNRGQLVRIFKK